MLRAGFNLAFGQLAYELSNPPSESFEAII